ncbi:TrkA C-terminal domain-containing protein [Sporomusa sp. KB1]|jgi:K+/H+ antiporter YhaU regulatory subunit KhtT|uniref:TrkA C-terminal domain-containing protein n=1 Tax=Sporomusa sp. KB1 TaxID=943346 RepID=UPI0011A8B62E|nr:TrkA C-terminal domain-containing protein [Sporomusa sp. KB1]TWH47421.1 putative regulatory, ligand-binding protein related to C-terminal domains of K+ channels [Sporomusa sp. KB1]
MKGNAPIFRAIALDIAQRIINSEFEEGSKISGRTLLAGHYNVSPETIRKAISLLKDEDVVEVSQGKEVTILSVEKAYNFIEHYKSSESVYSLRQDIEILLKDKRQLDEKFEAVLTEIINYSDRLRNLTPYNPVEIAIKPDAHIVGQTIGQLRLWQHTGATVMAIRRGTEIIISPGPSAVIAAYDRIVVVGENGIYQRTSEYFNRTSRLVVQSRES